MTTPPRRGPASSQTSAS
uniref:Uncharacterized protein n=1 Tax=Arundo donax TaxID=35708 RepID=A0A0A9JYC8_ARUDO